VAAMISPIKSAFVASPGVTLADFEPDAPRLLAPVRAAPAPSSDLIDGVTVLALTAHSDPRGSLCELLTTREGSIEPIVHVYQVTALPGSIRAWVCHRRQYDRLAFVSGQFRIALYDIRPGSPTRTMLNVFILGRERPGLLRIPPQVVHGVQNLGGETASFVNCPTTVYDPSNPDKCRLLERDPRIPFSFDER